MERGMERRVLEKLKTVGMDEKSFQRGQSYTSVLYDLDAENTKALEMMEGGMLTLPSFSGKQFPKRSGRASGRFAWI